MAGFDSPGDSVGHDMSRSDYSGELRYSAGVLTYHSAAGDWSVPKSVGPGKQENELATVTASGRNARR